VFLGACGSAPLGRAQAAARPVVRLQPGKALTNDGAWGGEARGAEGVLLYSDPRLAQMDSFSAALSFYPKQLGRDSVLLGRPGKWQIRLMANGALVLVTYRSLSSAQNSHVTQIGETDTWYQIAMAFDRARLKLEFAFRQFGDEASLAKGEFRMVAGTFGAATRAADTIEIGSPQFSGALDHVLLYDAALGPDALGEVLLSLKPSATNIGPPHYSTLLQTMPRDAGILLPKRSDVAMSSRSFHPTKPADTNDTLRDLAAFHATRLEWIYDPDMAQARKVKDAGYVYCPTINASDLEKGRPYSQRNFDGELSVFPWMISWTQGDGQPPGAACVNNARYRESLKSVVERAVRAGAGDIQYDDWATNVQMAAHAGECFCPYCVEKFRAQKGVDYHAYLKSERHIANAAEFLVYRKAHATDPMQQAYAAFQRESVRENLASLRKLLAENTAAGARRPSLSVNASFSSVDARATSWTAPDIPDYFVGEAGDETLAGLAINAKVAEALGRPAILSPFPYKVDRTRSEIALQYALGQLALVPYDIWMRTSDVPRYFGKPAEYADLFEFVREHAQLLDEAETVATVGIAIDPANPDDKHLRSTVESLVRASMPFVLVMPGKPGPAKRIAPAAEVTPELLREISVVNVEAENVIATVRASADFVTVHLVNRNFDEFGRSVTVEQFGVRFLHESFWGGIAEAELLAPGRKATVIPVKAFGRHRRAVIPEVRTWAILRLRT
jgi:hypothetical protein